MPSSQPDNYGIDETEERNRLDSAAIDVLSSGINKYSYPLFAFIQSMLFRFSLDGVYTPVDIFQEVYVRSVEAIRSGKAIANYSGWFRSTALNVIREHSRELRRYTDISSYDVSVSEDTVDSILEESELSKKLKLLESSISKLSKEDNELLTLRYIRGLSWKEIAEFFRNEKGTDIPTATLRKRGSRAIEALRKNFVDVKESNSKMDQGTREI